MVKRKWQRTSPAVSKNDRPFSVPNGVPTNAGSRFFKTARESGPPRQNGDFSGVQARRFARTKFTNIVNKVSAQDRWKQRTRFKINEIKVYPKMPSAGDKSLSQAKPATGPIADGPFAAASMLTIDEASVGQRLDNFLVTLLKGVPKSHVYRIVRSGEVRVNKGRVAADYRLVEGDLVRVPPVRTVEKKPNPSVGDASQAFSAGKARPALSLLFEDDALLAINKPAGLAVHGGSGISFGVIEALRALRPEAKFLELVHRIDRETSGVLLIAKKRSALTALHAMLRGDTAERIEKHYAALVKGAWPDERRHVRVKLVKYLTAGGERRVSVDEDDGQESHTIITRKALLPGATLLDCEIKTGRTHQIRVHLAHLGFPIIGDDKYGDFALNKHVAAAKNGGLKRMFLHARLVAFQHPLSGEKLVIEAPLSADLVRYLAHVRHG